MDKSRTAIVLSTTTKDCSVSLILWRKRINFEVQLIQNQSVENQSVEKKIPIREKP